MRADGDQILVTVAIEISGARPRHRQVVFEQNRAILQIPRRQPVLTEGDESRSRHRQRASEQRSCMACCSRGGPAQHTVVFVSEDLLLARQEQAVAGGGQQTPRQVHTLPVSVSQDDDLCRSLSD